MTMLLSKKDLKTVMGIPYCGQHLARMEADGRFPKRIKLGPNRVAWYRSAIEAWIENLAAVSGATRGTETSVATKTGG